MVRCRSSALVQHAMRSAVRRCYVSRPKLWPNIAWHAVVAHDTCGAVVMMIEPLEVLRST